MKRGGTTGTDGDAPKGRAADRGIEDAVQRQVRLGSLLVEQCGWRGRDVELAVLLDALGMAGLVLAEHEESNDLNPATVAAILDVVEPRDVQGSAVILDLDRYRARSHPSARR